MKGDNNMKISLGSDDAEVSGVPAPPASEEEPSKSLPSELRARFTELIGAAETLPASVRDMALGTPPRQRSDEEI